MKEYYELTKPGIIRGNLMTAVASFFLASRGAIDIEKLISLIIGIIFIVASGCVFNNVLDRDIDRKMARTKKRALVTGDISIKSALLFATTLGACGLFILLVLTTPTAATFGLLGLFFYVVVYGYAKRKTPYSTLIGSISGAIPPVIGYTAATNTVDIASFLLFLILVTWQMPHFYSIAIYRRDEYLNAGIPLLSIVGSVGVVKEHITFFIVLFLIAVSSLYLFGYAGIVYLVAMVIVGGWWLLTSISGKATVDDNNWAKKMFGISLIVILVFSIAITLQSFIFFDIV
jgi:heme o synthase